MKKHLNFQSDLISDEGLGNNSDKKVQVYMCVKEKQILEVQLCLITLIYTVGVCIIRRDIMVTILLTSKFYTSLLLLFTSFNLDNIQANLDKKVMQLLSIKGERKGRKICIFSSIGF